MSAEATRDAPEPRFPRFALLLGLARPHRGKLVLALFLALIGSATGLASPMVTKWILDSIAAGGSMTGPIVVLLVLLVIGSAVSFWQWIMLGTLAETIVYGVRTSIIGRLLHATVGTLLSRPSGELVTRVTADTVLLREATSSSLVGLANGIVMLVGTLILMGVLDLVLLATTLVTISIVTALFLTLMPAIAVAHEKAQERIGYLGATLEGAVRAIRTVKASRAEKRVVASLSGHARASADQSVHALRREALAWTIAFSGVELAIIIILGVGAWRVTEGQLAVSSLIAFLLYAFGLTGPIMELSSNVTALQSGVAAAGRLRELDTLEPEAEPGDTGAVARPPDSAAPALVMEDVSARYSADGSPAVRGIDLAIPRRGHVAIVGPSGAGKTTLFSLFLAFIRPETGRMAIEGIDYEHLSPAQLRARFGYVEQETPIVPGTIRDNLVFTHPEASEAEIARVLERVRLSEKIAALPDGLDTDLTTIQVSGGERQRIALARAILRAPAILLLDEATAQQDGLTEAAIQDCIAEQAKTGAVVTIAHRLSTVIDADTIIVMERGRIRAAGTHEALLETDTLYRALVEALRIAEPHAPGLAEAAH